MAESRRKNLVAETRGENHHGRITRGISWRNHSESRGRNTLGKSIKCNSSQVVSLSPMIINFKFDDEDKTRNDKKQNWAAGVAFIKYFSHNFVIK